MKPVADLPEKLGMLLKAISLSRVGLAQRLGVDKSLIGRWLSGAVHPTEHNLSRLTAIIAAGLPQFRLSDWDDDSAVLARRFGLIAPRHSAAPHGAQNDAWAEFWLAARPEIEARGGPYLGFWRTSRPSLLMSERIFHDYGIIHRRTDGMIEVLMGGSGLDFGGFLVPIGSNIFVALFDRIGRSPVTVLCRGVTLPRAMTLDGILTLAALDSNRTPVAMPIVVERVGELSEDPSKDLATYAEMIGRQPEPLEPLSEDVLLSRLFRPIGPEAAKRGGEMFLSVPSANNVSRGATAAGLTG